MTTTPARAARPGSPGDRPTEAWLAVVGAPDPVVRRLVGALAALGVRLLPPGAVSEGPSYGVVAFAPDAGNHRVAAERIRAAVCGSSARVIALTASSTDGASSWELLRAGASDVVTWDAEERAARQVADRLRRWRAVDELLAGARVREFLVGDSTVWRAVLREAVEVGRFTDAALLITGASGTGKERVAQLIHELDPRPAKKKMVVLDCSTIVASLSGSEFFGHEKGAFTGAATPRAGAFELADGGTLFLDEVGELPVGLQAELLRVVQEGTFKRVGSNTWRTSRFRLICATNRDLGIELDRGGFRRDFYYRIAACRLHLPDLEDRTDDIIPLFEHFFRQVHPEPTAPQLDGAVRELLLRRRYPGNVRDLRGLVQRIAHRYVGNGIVTVGDVPDDERPDPEPRSGAWPTTASTEADPDRPMDGARRRHRPGRTTAAAPLRRAGARAVPPG